MGLQTIVRQLISRENVWKLQLITFMSAQSKQIFLCAFRCTSMCTQVWPSVESVRIVWPSCGFKLTSPYLKYDRHVFCVSVCRLFNATVTNSDCIASIDWIRVSKELHRVYEKSVISLFNLPPWNLPGAT